MRPNSKVRESVQHGQDSAFCHVFFEDEYPSSNNYRRGGGSRNRVQRFIFEFGGDNING